MYAYLGSLSLSTSLGEKNFRKISGNRERGKFCHENLGT
jgi:hypothetical protein